MQLHSLDDYVRRLDESIDVLRPSRVRQLEWLRHDLDVVARRSLTTQLYRRTWDRLVIDRLDAMTIPTRVAGMVKTMRDLLRAESSGVVALRILFGQQRIAETFQAPNVNQAQIPGFPDDMATASLPAVIARLQRSDYLPDQIPIRIFWHARSNRWITANNRGYTAHCLAGVRPLRLLPTTFGPADIEITRLLEVEGTDGVGPWVGHRGGEPNPRRLPSERMFITPVGNTITQVAQVPLNWG